MYLLVIKFGSDTTTEIYNSLDDMLAAKISWESSLAECTATKILNIF